MLLLKNQKHGLDSKGGGGTTDDDGGTRGGINGEGDEEFEINSQDDNSVNYGKYSQ